MYTFILVAILDRRSSQQAQLFDQVGLVVREPFSYPLFLYVADFTEFMAGPMAIYDQTDFRAEGDHGRYSLEGECHSAYL